MERFVGALRWCGRNAVDSAAWAGEKARAAVNKVVTSSKRLVLAQNEPLPALLASLGGAVVVATAFGSGSERGRGTVAFSMAAIALCGFVGVREATRLIFARMPHFGSPALVARVLTAMKTAAGVGGGLLVVGSSAALGWIVAGRDFTERMENLPPLLIGMGLGAGTVLVGWHWTATLLGAHLHNQHDALPDGGEFPGGGDFPPNQPDEDDQDEAGHWDGDGGGGRALDSSPMDSSVSTNPDQDQGADQITEDQPVTLNPDGDPAVPDDTAEFPASSAHKE